MGGRYNGYNDEANEAIIDSKVIMDRVIWHADHNPGALAGRGIEREDARTVWRVLDDIIHDAEIPYEMQTEMPDAYMVETAEGIPDALAAVRERLGAIDDVLFWGEHGRDMGDAFDVLDNRCGLNL